MSRNSPHVSRVASPAKALKTAPRQGSGAGVSDSRHPHTPQNGAQRGLQQVYANVGGGALGQKPKRQEAPPPDEDEVGHYQVVIGSMRVFPSCGCYPYARIFPRSVCLHEVVDVYVPGTIVSRGQD